MCEQADAVAGGVLFVPVGDVGDAPGGAGDVDVGPAAKPPCKVCEGLEAVARASAGPPFANRGVVAGFRVGASVLSEIASVAVDFDAFQAGRMAAVGVRGARNVVIGTASKVLFGQLVRMSLGVMAAPSRRRVTLSSRLSGGYEWCTRRDSNPQPLGP